MNFWPWACLQNADAFLASSRDFRSHMQSLPDEHSQFLAWQTKWLHLQRLQQLHAYNFIMSVNKVVRTIANIAPKFPAMKSVCDAAEHLQKEGNRIRNMVEHADVNLKLQQAGKPPRGGFVRKSEAASGLPGTEPGEADATSLIVDENGHWLGGRLLVEKVIEEVRPILAAAKSLPIPPHDPNPPA